MKIRSVRNSVWSVIIWLLVKLIEYTKSVYIFMIKREKYLVAFLGSGAWLIYVDMSRMCYWQNTNIHKHVHTTAKEKSIKIFNISWEYMWLKYYKSLYCKMNFYPSLENVKSWIQISLQTNISDVCRISAFQHLIMPIGMCTGRR